MAAGAEAEASPLEGRPGILIVGSPNVGKRTILSRLLHIEFGDALDSSGTLCHGWTINTKYYSADVSIWTAHLDDEFSLGALPIANKLVAVVMVFDLNDLASFSTLKAWVSSVDMARFDILLCIANKVDLLPGHFAHVEYRRNLKKPEEFFSDPHPEFADYGILCTESSSLLGEEERPWVIRRSCLDWCIQHNIEYVEACASNADFDKCLSVNGDVQGMDRLYGALSAHMWPGMILKSGDKVIGGSPLEDKDLEASDEGSEFELEYEILSGGSAEPWDDSDGSWAAFTEAQPQMVKEEGATSQEAHARAQGEEQVACCETKIPTSDSQPALPPGSNNHASVWEESSLGEQLPSCNSRKDDEKDRGQSSKSREKDHEAPAENAKNPALENHHMAKLDQKDDEVFDGKYLEFEDMERLMSEIGHVRDNLRLMPDFQRRDMAANLAMKMAAMFGCGSDDE